MISICAEKENLEKIAPSSSSLFSPVVMNKEYGESVRSNNNCQIYSRKVFIGGLPPDIDEVGILASFHNFGELKVDWPGKSEKPLYMFPPKGYAFLFFESEKSVHQLITVCQQVKGLLYYHVSSSSLKNKVIEVKPWRISSFYLNTPQYCLIQKLQYPVFVGGIPRVFTSEDLAKLADNVFGSVSTAAVFVDNVWQYPKGSGFVLFSNLTNYFSALNQRYVSIEFENYQKELKTTCVEFKPLERDNVPKMYSSLLTDLHIDLKHFHHHNKWKFRNVCVPHNYCYM